jgi:predicted dehydrogenase
MNVIRMGVLGAARIAPSAVLRPARLLAPEIRIEALAARDPARARAMGEKFGIPRILGSYQELVDDPGIDAIYNPLPNSLHAEWTIRALAAGKHVLCEKPMGNNAQEVVAMEAAARKSKLVLMEAFHYRHHPLARRMEEIVASGELGELRHVEVHFCVPLYRFWDIRYRYDLGGGATMDLGCYCVNLIRFLTGMEPEVTAARARLAATEVDRYMEADFRCGNGVTAAMTCSFWSPVLLRMSVVARGEKGEMRVRFPFIPQSPVCRLEVRSDEGARTEPISREKTYTYQLRAFAAAVRGDGPIVTTAEDAVANMKVIDAIYAKAGLKLRGT